MRPTSPPGRRESRSAGSIRCRTGTNAAGRAGKSAGFRTSATEGCRASSGSRSARRRTARSSTSARRRCGRGTAARFGEAPARRRQARPGSRRRRQSARSALSVANARSQSVEDCGLKPCSRSPCSNLARFGEYRLRAACRRPEVPGPRGSQAPPGRPCATGSAPRRRESATPGSPPTAQHKRRDRPGSECSRPTLRKPPGASIPSHPAASATTRTATSASRGSWRAAVAYFRPRGIERLERGRLGLGRGRHRRRRTAPGPRARAGRPCPTSWHIGRPSRAAWAWPSYARP